jgi:4'-phosphopantetheinyl transferase
MREYILPSSSNPVSWLAPPELLMLKNNEVHVWRASLEMTPYQLKTMKSILSADELSRAGRYYFQKDRDIFIASRGLLRTILGRYLNMGPEELRFCYGPYGKPSLEVKTQGGEVLCFNVSHSHGLALFAFALEREIGVDLEHIRPDISTGDIAAQFFSQRETDALNSLPENIRRKVFFTFWTRKEALLKAEGKGLVHDLNQYEILPDKNKMHIIIRPGNGPQSINIWSLRDLDAGPGYAAALAIQGQGRRTLNRFFFGFAGTAHPFNKSGSV